MTEEQMAVHLQHINGLLMVLTAEAAQQGLDQVERYLESARHSVWSAGHLLEPPMEEMGALTEEAPLCVLVQEQMCAVIQKPHG